MACLAQGRQVAADVVVQVFHPQPDVLLPVGLSALVEELQILSDMLAVLSAPSVQLQQLLSVLASALCLQGHLLGRLRFPLVVSGA